jgi:fructokinase
MKNVFCIGETVLDIIFRDNQPVAAKPGGSMLNTAISLGRIGLDPFFISDLGLDDAGDLINDFLVENGVNCEFLDRFSNGQTAIALAFLDEDKDATYSFYRNFPEERLMLPLPEASPGDIVLFGSFYAITHEVRTALWNFLQKANEKGAFIIYDPNFRKPHLKDLPRFRPWIMENIGIADLTRGSVVDFRYIFEKNDAESVYREIVRYGGDALVYSKSDQGVDVITPSLKMGIQVPDICPVSTIGAGDAFNAGLIYSLLNHMPENINQISGSDWEKIINLAIQFSTNVCLSLENYISKEFAQQVSHV